MRLWRVVFASIIFLFLTGNVYAAADPIAYWKFDDGSGTAPVDSSGNSITGTFLTPNPTWSTDVPPDISFTDPYSLDFSDYHDGVTCAWPSGLNFGSTATRSFSFWYKPTGNGEADAGSFDRILSWDSDAFEIAGTFGNIATHEIAFYDGSWRDTGYALTVGTWYHITFTYDGTRARFYVGNDLKYNHAEGGRSLSGTMAIGTRQNGHSEGINGRIDDVRVYNYALDISQIENLTAGSNNPDAPPASPTPSPTSTPDSGISSNNSSSTNSSSSCSVSRLGDAPSLYQIDPFTSSVTIYFTPVSGANKYSINYGKTSSADQFGTTFNNSDHSGAIKYTVNSLDKISTYYFRVMGANDCSTGSWSKTLSATTKSSASLGVTSDVASVVEGVFAPTKKLEIVSSNLAPASPSPSPSPTSQQPDSFSLNVKVLGVNNEPLSGVDVTIHSKVQTAQTDSEGIAHLTGIETGKHKLQYAYNGYKGSQDLTVDGSQKDQHLTIQVKLTNGLPWGVFVIVAVGFVGVVGVLLFLLKKKHKAAN